MKIEKERMLLLWTGAVSPSYQPFFTELSKYYELMVVSPTRWKHGSYHLKLKDQKQEYVIRPSHFYPVNSSHYLVPMLPFIMRKFKPNILYLMDEIDRINTFFHLVTTKIFAPQVKIITYSLQNIKNPGYYKFYHILAIKLNMRLVSKVIAASPSAKIVLQKHGVKKPIEVIPLGVSSKYFYPGDKNILRKKHSFSLKDTIIIYAGSLAMEKGVLEIANEINSNLDLKLILIGNGPLKVPLTHLNNQQLKIYSGMPTEELREMFQLSDYVILPSKSTINWNEQIGRVLLEGILCGCIAIGSDNGYIPSITLAKEAQFNTDSSESLRDLFHRLPLSNKDSLYTAQLKNVQSHFLWDTLAEKTQKFISQKSK